VIGKYLLWQLPGWLVVGAGLWIVATAMDLAWWVVPAGIAVLVARDVVLYPAMRAAFRAASPTRPIGARGVAVDDLRPAGLVRVRGELWQAHAIGDPVAAREEVVVTDARGLTLLVIRGGPRPAPPCRGSRPTGPPP
jgi:membrane-bound ClpP family serine protease